jgi:tRNA-Thr(GGU) m(6)t(6)A37 methyltransferase TsaA
MEPFVLHPIGVLRTPFRDAAEAPIQGAFASQAHGEVEVFEEYAAGLRDVEGFSHLLLVYVFHRAGEDRLVVTPFLDDQLRGVFATRHPGRPNHLGLTVVELVARRGNVLEVRGVDMLDGTPVVDIKPYVPAFDAGPADARIGWLTDRREGKRRNEK